MAAKKNPSPKKNDQPLPRQDPPNKEPARNPPDGAPKPMKAAPAKSGAEPPAPKAPGKKRAPEAAAVEPAPVKSIKPAKPVAPKASGRAKSQEPGAEPSAPPAAREPIVRRVVKAVAKKLAGKKQPAAKQSAPPPAAEQSAESKAAPSAAKPARAVAPAAKARKMIADRVATPAPEPRGYESGPAAPAPDAPLEMVPVTATAKAAPVAAGGVATTAPVEAEAPSPVPSKMGTLPPQGPSVAPLKERRARKRTIRAEEPEPNPSGQSRLVLMARDPQTLHAFWTIAEADRARFRIGEPGGAPPLLLRLYDRDGEQGVEAFRSQVLVGNSDRWTIHVQQGGARSWRAELGFIGRDGRFKLVCTSNVISMQHRPAMTPPAELLEELRAAGVEWAGEVTAEGIAAADRAAPGAGSRLEKWASALGLQPGVLRELQPGSHFLPQQLAAGAQPASMPPPPPAGSLRPVPAQEEQPRGARPGREFWLQVHTELIVYGATDPSAQVTIQGLPIELRPDGTFSIRFALPEGYHVIPVQAVSEDGDQERTITPVVIRLTQ